MLRDFARRVRAFLAAPAQSQKGAIPQPGDLATLRQRLDRAQASAQRWKSRAADAAAGAGESAAQLVALRQSLQAGRERTVVLHREAPSPTLLRDVFAHRLRTLAARVDAAASRERETRLQTVSASYAAELERPSAVASPRAQRSTLDGLTWWIPVKAAARNEHWIERQRFPYRTILQTREVGAGGVMLDLGANVGRMSIPRVILGDVTAAYCAEPDPVNYACLAANVIDNGLRGLVLPDRTAIGDRDEAAQLLQRGSSGRFHIVPGAGAAPGDTIEVPCCTLDTWVERLGIDLQAVTFIKVDVEGFERRVIAGARRVLACRHIAWQMEIKLTGLRRAGDDPQALYADLQRSFTHFIDLNRHAPGPRLREMALLPETLRYIEPAGKTDILLFSIAPW